MKWLDRADQMSFPAKVVITFACLVFGLATTLATLSRSPRHHHRYAMRGYDSRGYNTGGGYRGGPPQPARAFLPLPTTALNEPNAELRAATLLPDGEVAGLFRSSSEELTGEMTKEGPKRVEVTTFRATDSVDAWQQKSLVGVNNDLNNLHFVDQKRGWAYSVGNKLYRTVDGGVTWQQIKLPVELVIGDMAWLSPQTGFIAGSRYSTKSSSAEVNILRTMNGGRSWQLVGGFSSELAVWKLLAPTRDNLLMNVGGVDLYISSDGGENWRDALFEGGVQDITCNALGEGWAIKQNGWLYALHNYGAEYDGLEPTGLPRGRRWRAIDIQANGVGLLVGDDRLAAVTEDGGATWLEARLTPTETDQVPYLQNFNRVQVRGEMALVANGSRMFRIGLSSLVARNVAPPEVKTMRMNSVVTDVPPPLPPPKPTGKLIIGAP
jgi:photosystem II stability/assembly factor-like uncharacterized protein